MDHMVDVDEKPTMIFRNPAKDMLTLAASGVLRGKLLFSVRFQSAAEIAERDRKIKEAAPKLLAAAEAKAAKGLERRRRVNGRHGRHTLILKEGGQSVTITYSDTGFMPSEVSVSAMRAELEAAK
jgi:hypothetical protein